MSVGEPGEWSEEKCLQLIREFRIRPTLWDQKYKYFFKRALKPAAWKEIGDAIGVCPNKCKHKMIVLMSSFRREKARIMRNLKEVKDPSQVYKSSWFAFKEMAFLLDKENERKRQLNGEEDEDDAETIQISDLTMLKDHLETPPPPCKRIRRSNSSKHTVSPSPHTEVSAPGPSQTVAERNEEIQSFTSFIGNKMKKYSDTTKNAVQQAICEVIFKADQHYYESSLYDKFTIIDDEPDPLNKTVYTSPDGTVIKIQNESDSD